MHRKRTRRIRRVAVSVLILLVLFEAGAPVSGSSEASPADAAMPMMLIPENPNGSITIEQALGATGDIVGWLKSHEHDSYYLGTPYKGLDVSEELSPDEYMKPNGENGGAGAMNCTGFVAHVLRHAGADLQRIPRQHPGWYANASNWEYYANEQSVKSYHFDTIQQALDSGKLQKGDVLYFEPLDWDAPGADCHIGFFWGDTPSDDRFWHSSTHPSEGNQISEITAKAESTLYVFPIRHTSPLQMRKTSSEPALTDGNANYSLEGTVYDVYNTQSDAQNGRNSAATLTVRANGLSNAVNLFPGRYYYKETSAGKGYKKDGTVHEVTLDSSGDTKVETAEDTPVSAPFPVTVVKQDEAGRKITAGTAVFKVQYFDNYTGAGAAKRTWYFETKNGELALAGVTESDFADGYRSGALFKDARGRFAAPLGTYVFTEEKAPNGYQKTRDSFKAVLQEDSAAPSGVKWTCTGSSQFVYNSDTNVVAVENKMPRTTIVINKNNNAREGNADFAGIQITVRNISGHEVVLDGGVVVQDNADVPTKITLDADGRGSISLPYGTFEARETRGNDFYAVNASWRQKIEITPSGDGAEAPGPQQSYDLSDEIYKAGLTVYKQDADRGASVPQGDASLAGAQYRIWNESQNAVTVSGQEYKPGSEITSLRLTTNEQGVAETAADALPMGTYRLQESRPGPGYKLPEQNPTYTVTLTPQQKGTLVDVNASSKTPEPVIRGGVRFFKIDAEAGEAKPQGEGAIAGAEITIYNNSQNAVVKPDGTLIQKGAAYAALTTAEDGTCSLQGLPYGSYYAKETKAPQGYNLNTDWRVDFQIRTEGETVDLTRDQNRLAEKIIRGDLSFVKVNIDGTGKGMIPFRISRLGKDGEAEESHIIVSDENGYVNTAARSYSDAKVNSMDSYYADGKFSDSSRLDPSAGVWFGSAEGRKEGRGALIFGTYIITELQCADSGQKEEDLLQSDRIEVRKEGVTVSSQTLIDLSVHLTSEALDVGTGTRIATVSREACLADSVRYDHLKTTNTYTMETIFYNAKLDGSRAELGRGSTEFTPEKVDSTDTAYGTVTVKATCDTTGMEAGSSIVAVDFLYEHIDGNTILIAAHEDYRNADQTLYVPALSTTASDGGTSDQVGTAQENAVIKDAVAWTNLPDSKMFKVTGFLKDKDTGETLKNADGEEIADVRCLRINWKDSEVTQKGAYWQGPKDGVLDMELAYDASKMAGRTIVVCETVSDMDSGAVYIAHESLLDEMQSVSYVDVHTTALDGRTKDHIGTIGEMETIVDQVQLDNLLIGQTYTVRGTLHYQEDCVDAKGTPHKAGDPLGEEQSATVTATSSSMTVELVFTVDSTLLEGMTAVVFEDIYHNDVKVASHADLTDEAQSVHYPKVRTSARDGSTGVRTGIAGEKAVIVDTVVLENLEAGAQYQIQGTLYDMEGNPFKTGGEPVMQTIEFTAEQGSTSAAEQGDTSTAEQDDTSAAEQGSTSAAEQDETSAAEQDDTSTAEYIDMSLDMPFEFDGSELSGKAVVVYQTLRHNGIDVARHEDPNDESETVRYPNLQTKAADFKTKDSVGSADGETILTDRVSYENVAPGIEYTVRGSLFYQSDYSEEDGTEHKAGDPVLDAGGKQYQGEHSWVPSDTEGEVTVAYAVNLSRLQGATLVIGEELYHGDVSVVSHMDKDNKQQTVWYPGVHTAASDGTTGDHTGTVGEKETIVDQVTLTNLIVGQTYTVKGTLHYQEDFTDGEGVSHKAGDPFGGEVTLEVEATEPSMTVELVYEVDSTLLEGTTVVVFEELYHNEVKVGFHADLTDEAQSVHYPKVRTHAEDGYTETGTGVSCEDAVILDAVTMENLVVGHEYRVQGSLRSADGELFMAGGKPVEAAEDFTAEETDMRVELSFTFDARGLNGQTLVVYEELLHEGITVASHSDPDDSEQTIGYPGLATTAANRKTGDHTADPEPVTVVDTVDCTHLSVGKEYVVRGVILHAETGEPVLQDNKAMQSDVVFTAETENQTVEVPFEFDAGDSAGETLVISEKLYFGDRLLAEHTDLSDENQQIHVREAEKEEPQIPIDETPPEQPEVPKTGDATLIFPWVCGFLAAGAALVCLLFRKRHTRRRR